MKMKLPRLPRTGFRPPKVGIIDWYIIRKFIGTYFFAIMLIILIVLIFDAAEKIDDFLELHAPLRLILFQYYLNFIPFFVNQFSGLITFIAVIFFTSKMAYNTEIIAILSNGISFKRILWPYFLSALFITVLSLGLNLFIIPHSNQKRLEFESQYLKKGKRDNIELHTYRQITPNTVVYVKEYSNLSKKAAFLVLETYNGGEIVSSLYAQNVSFDESTRRWRADRYFTRTYDDAGKEVLVKKQRLDTMINISAEELGKVKYYIQTLNIFRLNKFIKEQKQKGSDMISLFQVEKHNRIAYPVSTFILTLIGVSLSSRKVRGGTGLHIGIGILLCFSYILFMQFGSEFAKGGLLPAGIAVWIPNVIFAFIAVYLYKRAPK